MIDLLFGGPWKRLVSADRDYQEAKADFLNADPVEELRKQFRSASDIHAALRFLDAIAWSHPSVAGELIPEVFYWACMQARYSGLARRILVTLRPRDRDAELEPLIAAEMNNLTADRWDQIRGLVWLLEDLGRADVLAELKTRLLASADEELLDIAEDIDGPPEGV
ncbi:hypothetical protein GCM10029976_050910 [Kribbella albertanoniae]|uniref:HEAT repeat domain-containing protein n=1 Tax=Kribbella albertanoniae TaxID=1266829 RepID=A0A4R4PAA2_9ACTN|nr:hypothetical protein [Kribbella albertanoniae]TDC17867.1 hypothetical protein E1261_36260 [Kribbella albertanoniae]